MRFETPGRVIMSRVGLADSTTTPGPVADDATDSAISVRSVSLWYGSFQALFDVDLEVKAGSITALMLVCCKVRRTGLLLMRTPW